MPAPDFSSLSGALSHTLFIRITSQLLNYSTLISEYWGNHKNTTGNRMKEVDHLRVKTGTWRRAWEWQF